MSWRDILAFLHLLPSAPPALWQREDRPMARAAIEDLQTTVRQAQTALLDHVVTRHADGQRSAMRRDANALRETLAAVASRADRRHR